LLVNWLANNWLANNWLRSILNCLWSNLNWLRKNLNWLWINNLLNNWLLNNLLNDWLLNNSLWSNNLLNGLLNWWMNNLSLYGVVFNSFLVSINWNIFSILLLINLRNEFSLIFNSIIICNISFNGNLNYLPNLFVFNI